MEDEILTISQAAKICGVSGWTLRKFANSGELIASRTPGGHYRIFKKDFEGFIIKKKIFPLRNKPSSSNKILIVDDDIKILELLTKMLSREGYQTEVAADGFEAGTKIMKFQPGLILLDLIMPGMSGFEVCKKIKENPDTFHIKILAITGYDNEENKDRIMKAGADGYLAKPLEMSQLFSYIEDLLKNNEKKPIKMEI